MNKIETDLEKIKEMAIAFLMVEIEPTKIDFIASHPFTSSWFSYIDGEGIVDLHDNEVADRWRKEIKKTIQKLDLKGIFFLLNKPYILNFLKFTEKYLSDEDLGTILSIFWQTIEQISLDNSISGTHIVKIFKRASKETLMNEDERKIFNSLPEQVTVYRGVTSYNKNKKKAFSWTTDKEIAEWFANRYNTGTGEVWTLTVPKERILCAFEGREKEVIVNLYNYKNAEQMIVHKL